MKLRDDIRLAAYAVSLGYTLHFNGFTDAGDPKNEIRFRRAGHGIEVSLTAMGWRVFEEDTNTAPGQIVVMWKRPDPNKDFFLNLKKALDEGIKR